MAHSIDPIGRAAARRLSVALLVASAVLPSASAQDAPPVGGAYRIERSTVDGGGGRSTGGAFTLDGTIGQPDPGIASGGAFVLAGGYWSRGATATTAGDALFKDGFENASP